MKDIYAHITPYMRDYPLKCMDSYALIAGFACTKYMRIQFTEVNKYATLGSETEARGASRWHP